MRRRTLLKSSTAVIGFGITGSAVASFVSGCQMEPGDGWKPSVLSHDHVNLLAEVCERIIPKTDTPGAKDAMVHRYLDSYIDLNLSEEDATNFKSALGDFNNTANDKYGKKFVKLEPEEMDAVLNVIADKGGNLNIFEVVKGMTIPAFFTSEIGATKVLIFDSIPGVWEACIPLAEVGGTWAMPYPRF